MISEADISKMTQVEKLQIMEALWTNLSQKPEDLDSPSWHQEELKKTEARLKSGEENILDWEAAKEMLRKRFE